METKKAFVRRPATTLADGIVTHIDREPVDLELARSQWAGYVKALQDHGWATIEVPAADDCPDSVFIEDTMLVYGDLAVIMSPGADSRKPEIAGAEKSAREAGYRIARIEEPGTMDGGDILKFGGTVWVGMGGRSNQEGVDQLAELLAPLGATVVGVPLTKVLHLKSAVTALPDGTVIGYEPLVDDPSVWQKFMPVPEEAGSHVVLLDGNTLLMAASAPKTIRLLQDKGYHVVAVDISEYEKLEGCVTCLSVRLRGLPS